MPASDDSTQDDQQPQPQAEHRDEAHSGPPRYEILRELGRGGIGVVYLARETTLNRLCALKFLRVAQDAGAPERARFLREAQALARLRHANIVQVYEVGEHDGQPYMALEYCAGGTVADRLRDKPLAATEAANLVRQMALAVHAGHEAGILHRDIKPGNILIQLDGERAIPKLADFGLARSLAAEPGAEITRSGAIVGTPAYMPPEQASGSRAVGPAADVYSLGALLYACLTGRPPHLAATLLETLLQVMTEEPVPVRQLNPGVPRDLATILHKCLRKEPAKRYASAKDLADDLGRFLEGRPILARPVGAVERAWRWVRRNPLVSALTALVFLVLVTGIAVSTFYADRANRLAEAALAREAEAKAETYRANLARHAGEVERGVRAFLDRDLIRLGRVLNETQPDFADRWEVRHLRDLERRAFTDLPGHPRDVIGVALARDGGLALTACGDGVVRIWNAHTGDRVRSAAVPGGGVTGVAIHPEGRWFATTDRAGGVRVWETATGQEVRVLSTGRETPCGPSFSQDGNWLLAADGSTLKLWAVPSWELGQVYSGHRGMVVCTALSPDATRILSGSVDDRILAWDAASGEILDAIKKPFCPRALAFSPDGTRFAVSTDDEAVELRNTATGAVLLASFEGHQNSVLSLAFHPGGLRLAGGGIDEAVTIWDARSGQPLSRLQGHRACVRQVCFSPNGEKLLSAAGSEEFAANTPGEARLWHLDASQVRHRLPGHRDIVLSLGFLSTGQLVSRSHDGSLRLWDVEAGRPIRTLVETGAGRVAIVPGGREILVRTEGRLRRFDPQTGAELAAVEKVPPGLEDFAPLGEGHELALLLHATDGDGVKTSTLQLLDVGTSKLRPLALGPSLVRKIHASPDGRSILSEGDAGRLRLGDVTSGEERWTHKVSGTELGSCCYSPDGSLIAVTSGEFPVLGNAPRVDGEVRLLETSSGREIRRLKGHTGMIHDAAFSPDGKLLVTGAADRTVRLWDVATGQSVVTLHGSPNWVLAVAFSPDGRTIAGAGEPEILLWRAP